MLIPNQKKECLWCGRRLADYDPEPWQTCVRRSDEHIIPRSIGGKIKTRDLCRPCNSEFGRICDHALVKDQRIIRAAEAAGFKFTDFHETFRGTQKTETGGDVPTRYERGEFKPKPQLRPDSNLLVPLEEWKKLRPQIRGSLIAKVRRKNLARMGNARIASEVDKLLAAVDADPSKRHYSETIGEGFQLTASSGPVSVPIEMFPWETDWCLAKIVVELANVTWPREYQIYFRPAIQIFRDFLQKQDHDPETKSGKGIFEYTELSDAAVRQHVVFCNLSPIKLEWRLIFFGKAQWRWETNVKPIKAPPGKGWKIKVTNTLTGHDGTVECNPL
jgi:hypothetical protein